MHFNNSLLAFTLLGAAVCADPLFSFEHPLGPVRDAVVVLVAPNNQLIYKPNQIEVAVGTEIQFIFQDGVSNSSYFSLPHRTPTDQYTRTTPSPSLHSICLAVCVQAE
jgi:plastocyanin